MQYEAYSSVGVAKAVPSSDGVAKNAPVQQPPAGQNQAANEAISGAPKFEPENQQVVSKEERVEYRDQNGNLLDEEQVKALEGKVDVEGGGKIKSGKVKSEGGGVKYLSDKEAAAALSGESMVKAVMRDWEGWCREVEVNLLYRNEVEAGEE